MRINIISDKRTIDINAGVFGSWHIVTRLRTAISEVRISTVSTMYLMFVDPCIIVRFIKKNPTRCNNVTKYYYSIFV
jgi:hypothetical protein